MNWRSKGRRKTRKDGNPLQHSTTSTALLLIPFACAINSDIYFTVAIFEIGPFRRFTFPPSFFSNRKLQPWNSYRHSYRHEINQMNAGRLLKNKWTRVQTPFVIIRLGDVTSGNSPIEQWNTLPDVEEGSNQSPHRIDANPHQSSLVTPWWRSSSNRMRQVLFWRTLGWRSLADF